MNMLRSCARWSLAGGGLLAAALAPAGGALRPGGH
jgi:hypothetical protein